MGYLRDQYRCAADSCVEIMQEKEEEETNSRIEEVEDEREHGEQEIIKSEEHSTAEQALNTRPLSVIIGSSIDAKIDELFQPSAILRLSSQAIQDVD